MSAHMRLAAVAVATSLVACASASGGAAAAGEAAVPRTSVVVENNNWADMNVYVERNGVRARLGTVTTATRQVFYIPRTFVSTPGTFRLLADPIGGAAGFASEPLLISAGQRVELTIENQVTLSSFSVWN